MPEEKPDDAAILLAAKRIERFLVTKTFNAHKDVRQAEKERYTTLRSFAQSQAARPLLPSKVNGAAVWWSDVLGVVDGINGIADVPEGFVESAFGEGMRSVAGQLRSQLQLLHRCLQCGDLKHESELYYSASYRDWACIDPTHGRRPVIGSQCTRCNLAKPRVYHLIDNPSVTWSVNGFESSQMPRYTASCTDCLTSEESIELLGPIVYWVVRTLLHLGKLSKEQMEACACLDSYLMGKIGPDLVKDDDMVRKVLNQK
jgi:hypothetical protein